MKEDNSPQPSTSKQNDESLNEIMTEVLTYLPEDQRMPEVLKAHSESELKTLLELLKSKESSSSQEQLDSETTQASTTPRQTTAEFINEFIDHLLNKIDQKQTEQTSEIKSTDLKSIDPQQLLSGLTKPQLTGVIPKRKAEETSTPEQQKKRQRKM